MSSSSLTLAHSSSSTTLFALVGDNAAGSRYLVGGRLLTTPYTIEISRKLATPGSVGNDHIILKASRTQMNNATGKYGTSSVTVDLSMTRVVDTVTQAQCEELLGVIASLLNDSAVLAQTSASSAVRLALVEGRNV